MHILITGGGGLVGSYLVEYLQRSGKDVLAPTAEELDITKQEIVSQYIQTHPLDVVIHCAAYTDVSKAEQERNNVNGTVWNINVRGTVNLATACRQNNVRFIHISTDMVFSGLASQRGPYRESDTIAADTTILSWYGASKAQAEREVLAIVPKATIIRISNPIRSTYTVKKDYVHKILAAYDEKRPISLFTDQYLTISYIPDIARAIEVILQKSLSGIFHVSSPDMVTPFAFGTYAIKTCRKDTAYTIAESLLEAYFLNQNNHTRYLQYGGLSVIRTQEQLAIRFTPWQSAMNAICQDESASL